MCKRSAKPVQSKALHLPIRLQAQRWEKRKRQAMTSISPEASSAGESDEQAFRALGRDAGSAAADMTDFRTLLVRPARRTFISMRPSLSGLTMSRAKGARPRACLLCKGNATLSEQHPISRAFRPVDRCRAMPVPTSRSFRRWRLRNAMDGRLNACRPTEGIRTCGWHLDLVRTRPRFLLVC